MVILHIACIHSGDVFNGVRVVVPKHVENQAKFAEVAFINVYKDRVLDNGTQLECNSNFDINTLPMPYNKPDLVVFHEVYRPEYLKIYKNLMRNRIPYIIIPHGELSTGAQKKKRIKKIVANVLLFNRFICNSRGLQCLSEKEKSDTKFNVYRFIGSNGIDIPLNTKRMVSEANKNKLVYIGRLDLYHKGIDLLLSAIEEIKKEYPNIRLEIYGPDCLNRKETIETLIKEKDLADMVSVHAPVVGDEKQRVLEQAGFFIQTSRFEGMPMGILEALSYSIPCIITEGTTLGNYFRKYNAGWVAENEASSICKAIKEALQSSDMERSIKGNNAYNLVLKEFSWNIIANNTIEEYKKIINI